MTRAPKERVTIADHPKFVRRSQAGQVGFGAALLCSTALLAVGAFVALGSSFERTIADGTESVAVAASAGGETSSESGSRANAPQLTSASQAYETTDMGMAIFPYGEVDEDECNGACWAANIATLPLELAGSQQNREAWLTGTVETAYGLKQLVQGGFNAAGNMDNAAGVGFRGFNGVVNGISSFLTGNKVFDGKEGVDMAEGFVALADFENNGMAGGLGRMGMMMMGSIWNEFLVMGSSNRQNASYALGAWTIDILPWLAALRPTSHAAMRAGYTAQGIIKGRAMEVAKEARLAAKQQARLAATGATATGVGAATAAVVATDASRFGGLMTPSSPYWSMWSRRAGMSLETVDAAPGQTAVPGFILPDGSTRAIDGSVTPATAASRAEFARGAAKAGVQQGPNGLTRQRLLLPDGSEYVPELAEPSTRGLLLPGQKAFETSLADVKLPAN